MNITEIENRFKEITLLSEMDLSKYPIRKADYTDQQQKTTKEAAKERGYITTPIFLVDIMIALKYKELTPELQTCDLCAGEAGQFTIRLMRMLFNKFNMNVEHWLKNNHTLTELEPSACAKLVYIYGPDINLYVGDSLKLNYSEETDIGILFFNEETKKWDNNKLLNELIHIPIVRNNLKLLTFIFENHINTNKLTELKQRINYA